MSDITLAREIERLREAALAGRLSRRQVLRRATALGLSAPVIATLLAACGGSGSSPTATPATTTSAAPTATTTSGGTSAATPAATSAAPAVIASPAASPAASFKPPSKDQTFVYPQDTESRTLDPGGASETQSIDITQSAYEGLVAQAPSSADIVPRLAKSWQIAPGAQSVTFTLQQGVKFHDGTVMDAAAVKSSFERVIKLNLGPAAVLSGVDTIEVVDPATVRINLKLPNAYFVQSLTGIGIISPAAVQKNDKGGDLAAAWLEAGNTAGTGPYRLTEFKKNETKTLEAFKDYWRGWDDKKLTKIVLPIVPEATTRRQMLEKGQAHYARNMPPDDIKALLSNPAVKVDYVKSYGFWTMPLNVAKAPTDNLKFRQALQLAFPYDQFLQQVWLGKGKIPNGPTAPGFIGYDDSLPTFKQDLQKAKQLITESGITNATLEHYYTETIAEEGLAATVLQDVLKGLGITMNVTAMPWPVQFGKVSNLDSSPHMTNLKIGPVQPDPAFALDWVFGTSYKGKPYNWSYYSNPQVDDLISQARASADLNKGADLLKQATRLAVADAPIIWYGLPDRSDVHSARVQNWQPIVVGYPGQIDYYGIYLSD